ncbi:MAG: hypothetical protein AABW45_00125 [Nanoarchaeota archaeon]
MAFKEEGAIKTINDLLNFNDYSKIRQVLQSINPEVFVNKSVKTKFKEVLINMYNKDDTNYLKDLLNDFLKVYNEYKGVYHLAYFSEQFLEKLNRKDFRNPVEVKRFREIIQRIVESKKDYPTETIGEFFISPRGHERHRVVWFIQDNAVYFCEMFYDHKEYDNFCDKIRERKILKKNYRIWAYTETLDLLNLKAA